MAEWYSFDELDKTGANYRIVYGERSNGKTYAFKYKALKNYIEKGKQFVVLRRQAEEIKLNLITNYFADMTELINKMFAEVYPQFHNFFIEAKGGSFNLKAYDANDEIVFIDVIGYYFALIKSGQIKGNQYPNVTLIGYDEFMTKGRELHDEFSLLLNFISTIKRKREDLVIYMMGNTVDRNSTLLNSMGINIRDIHQGEIKCYQYANNEGKVVNTVAVEYCKTYEQSETSAGFFQFGTPKEMMIVKGEWEVDEYNNYEEDAFYEQRPVVGLIFECENIRLYAYGMENGELWVDDTRLIKRFDYITLTNGDTIFNRKTFNMKTSIPKIQRLMHKIHELNVNGMIKYKNNLIGDDFNYCLKFS